MPAVSASAAAIECLARLWRGAPTPARIAALLALAAVFGLTAVLAHAAPSAAAAAAAQSVPVVAAIAPNNGAGSGGAGVTITGTGFSPGSTVFFGGSPARSVTVRSPNLISTVSPPGSGTVAVRVRSGGGSSEDVPQSRFAYDPPPSYPWLGLNGLSISYLGDAREYVELGIAFDRSGPIEWTAGEGLARRGAALEADLRAGMIPVVTIEYSGYDGRYRPDARFPTEAGGSRSLQEYVTGFLATASAITSAHPGARILFEPINEPWGYTSPQFSGGQYAAVIAKLLPAAREAHIPPQSIYVGATGKHWIAAMYAARPALRTEVEGWYLHPYGPPHGSVAEDSMGIESVPRVQATMDSGQNNLIVSEIGFCALDVNEGHSCGFIQVPHGEEAAAMLTETLQRAAEYHAAGWLRALIVYSRNDGGWAMQLARTGLTAQGEALTTFAAAHGGPPGAPTPPGLTLALAPQDGPPYTLPALSGVLLCSLPGAFVCSH